MYDTYKNDEKITTNFEPIGDSDVINKAYLDEKLKKIDGHIYYIEKNYNEFKLKYNKQSVEDILIKEPLKRRCKYYMMKVYLIIMLMMIKF